MMLGTPFFAARPLARTLRMVVIAGASLTLASCAGLSNSGLFPEFGGGAETTSAPADTMIDAQPLAQQAVDPLSAPPPDAMAAAGTAGDGSQRVPLGALTAGDLAAGTAPKPAPAARTGPAPLVPSGQPSAAPKPAMPAAPAPQPQAAPTPAMQAQAPQAAAPQAPMPAAAAPPAPTPPSPPSASVAPAIVAPMPTPAPAPAPTPAPSLPSVATAQPAPPAAIEFTPDAVMAPDPASVSQAREFVPAQIGAAAPLGVMSTSGAPRLTLADSNIMRRFQALSMLLDDGLITQEEHDKRRAANVGAMLPYSKEPPGIGLDRAVPSANAIAARLQALGRSLEMRAITPRQHSLERLTILNSLMPERPDPRAPRMAPPSDMFAVADAAARLGLLREENLISEDEFEAEKAAMDRLMRGGDAGVDKKGTATAAPAKATPAAASADSMAAEAANDPLASQKFRGPVLHLASFRTEQAARNAYAQAIAKNPAQFANLKPEYRKTDLGEKQGIFYRLLVGPFSSLSEAEAACIEMKKVDQFCRSTPDGS
ncbi:MAG: SPOR domain-containing protein [Rhodospirillaceae bacterium]|nr:SPOR domain-containing protein [Rhodospirillaceae bacterium]